MVEKPMTMTSEQSIELLAEAKRQNRILMVDHTFVYTGAVRKMAELVSSKELGDIYYYDSVRVNLGLFQHDVNVLWDLAVHDLSIMDYVLPAKPYAVSATGISHVPNGTENIAYLTLFFENNLIAHLHVNWLAPVKIRRTLIGGSQKMIVFDDLDPSEKIKLKMFHSQIIYDTDKTNKENEKFMPIPKVSLVDQQQVMDNFFQVKYDIRRIIEIEVNRLIELKKRSDKRKKHI